MRRVGKLPNIHLVDVWEESHVEVCAYMSTVRVGHFYPSDGVERKFCVVMMMILPRTYVVRPVGHHRASCGVMILVNSFI